MATAALLLREGGAADLDAVEALVAAAFEPRWGEAWTRAQCAGVLGLAGVRLTLALVDCAAAGFALVREVADEAELLLLAVAPPHRRRGVGAALLAAAVERARGAGLVHLHLEVRAGNAAARLYQGAGFGKVGERRAYYRGRGGEAFDAHSYRLALAPPLVASR